MFFIAGVIVGLVVGYKYRLQIDKAVEYVKGGMLQ